ncbi:hypothetical protein [Streptomyces sp. NPDC003015]
MRNRHLADVSGPEPGHRVGMLRPVGDAAGHGRDRTPRAVKPLQPLPGCTVTSSVAR